MGQDGAGWWYRAGGGGGGGILLPTRKAVPSARAAPPRACPPMRRGWARPTHVPPLDPPEGRTSRACFQTPAPAALLPTARPLSRLRRRSSRWLKTSPSCLSGQRGVCSLVGSVLGWHGAHPSAWCSTPLLLLRRRCECDGLRACGGGRRGGPRCVEDDGRHSPRSMKAEHLQRLRPAGRSPRRHRCGCVARSRRG
jgi:hypothetical protein